MTEAVSVSQLNLYVKSLLESDSRLSYISVKGEISNFKNHFSSGHWYFTLKDSSAAVKCVMFRNSNIRVKAEITDGTEVVLSGRVSLYEKEGGYQFYAEEMSLCGEGDLTAAFNATKEKLEKEGLFEAGSKRKLPAFPGIIAVITSASGAAIQDIINITSRRFPLCSLVLCPVSVQGEGAAGEMVSMLERVYKTEGIDLIIIGRGGGSAEDLSAFNDEMLARKIYESPVPVISAVGHETDFSISDFVADMRASTPSAAAELAVPDISELIFRIKRISRVISACAVSVCNSNEVKFQKASARANLMNPERIITQKSLTADMLSDRIMNIIKSKIEITGQKLNSVILKIDALSPLKTLARGYGEIKKDGKKISSINELKKDDELSICLSDGKANCKVTELFERSAE